VLLKGPRREVCWQPVSLEGIAGDQSLLEDKIDEWRKLRPAYSPWVLPLDPHGPQTPRFGRLLIDGIEFACRDARAPAHPLLLGAGREEVLIPMDRTIRAVAVLGHVTALNGYPYSTIPSVFAAHPSTEPARALGTLAAAYEFEFDEETLAQPLRYGCEILRGNDICRYWMTEPRASDTRPAARAVIDPTYEVLRVDLWERQFAQPRHLRAIRWRLADPEAILMLYALSVQIDR
jgi:hypothetical protein